MKKILLIISAFLLFSCKGFFEDPYKDEKRTTKYKPGVQRVVGFYVRSDSTKVLDILLREIVKVVDSNDNIIIDTLWAYPKYNKDKDSTIITLISKDSVIWDVSGIPVNELLIRNDRKKN